MHGDHCFLSQKLNSALHISITKCAVAHLGPIYSVGVFMWNSNRDERRQLQGSRKEFGISLHLIILLNLPGKKSIRKQSLIFKLRDYAFQLGPDNTFLVLAFINQLHITNKAACSILLVMGELV